MITVAPYPYDSNIQTGIAHSAVTIVSGLPRSGTSMLMQMLDAGGMPVVVDHVRQPDADNPHGYYEYEPVKNIKNGDRSWLHDCRGNAVKIVSPLLEYLPHDNHYRVIFIKRKIAEVLASQKKMASRLGGKDIDASEMAEMYEKHLRYIMTWLSQQPDMETIYIHHIDMIKDPFGQTQRMNQFLGRRLDERKMVQMVDPSLHRQKKP